MTECPQCKGDFPLVKSIDCGKTDVWGHFKQLNEDTFEEHGLFLIKCNLCHDVFCDDCQEEHASFEVYG